jgi:cell cycle checkpoint control protein RAD9A
MVCIPRFIEDYRLSHIKGVVKTHRLVLSIPLALMAPGVPDTLDQARVHIGPAGLRNMLEHFPMQRGTKADPQLIWTFNESEVGLKTCESSMDKSMRLSSTAS